MGADAELDTWRVQARVPVRRGARRRWLRRPDPLVRALEAAAPYGSTVTVAQGAVSSYAKDERVARAIRDAIAATLAREGVRAPTQISRWSPELEGWVPTDPPPADPEAWAEAERREHEVITDTVVSRVGRLGRAEIARRMEDAAVARGLAYDLDERRHLLGSVLTLTVTGERHLIDDLAIQLYPTWVEGTFDSIGPGA
jgi:hypothetical protein